MTKKAGKQRAIETFRNLEKISEGAGPALSSSCCAEDEPLDLTTLVRQPIQLVADSSKTLRMKKFRAQLLHAWLVRAFPPCRAGDIGGGKGLLSYLLIQDGWKATVIDPYDQPLPDKFKDISSDQRVKIPPEAKIPRLAAEFRMEQAANFDLLIGMHAHGCNAAIIDAAAAYGCGFVIFPCCVIDEPFFPRLGVQWIEALADYAVYKGLEIFPFRLNFKGQNIGLCHRPGVALVDF